MQFTLQGGHESYCPRPDQRATEHHLKTEKGLLREMHVAQNPKHVAVFTCERTGRVLDVTKRSPGERRVYIREIPRGL